MKFFSDITNEIKQEHSSILSGIEQVHARLSEVANNIAMLGAVIKGEKAASIARYGRYATSPHPYENQYTPVVSHYAPAEKVEIRGTSLTTMPEANSTDPNKAKLNLNEQPVIDQFLFDRMSEEPLSQPTETDPVEAELQAMITSEKQAMTQNDQANMVQKAQEVAANTALSARETNANIAKITQ